MSTRAFKILTAAQWASFAAENLFDGSPDDRADGFIHLSTADQVDGTIAKHFSGHSNLVIAEIELARLGDMVRWEPSRGGQLFPHIYGVLTMDAVVGTQAVRTDLVRSAASPQA